jgi:ribosomal protein L37AE/L43A
MSKFRKTPCTNCDSICVTRSTDYSTDAPVWYCNNCGDETPRQARTRGTDRTPSQQKVLDRMANVADFEIQEVEDNFGETGKAWVRATNGMDHILLEEDYSMSVGRRGHVEIKLALRCGSDRDSMRTIASLLVYRMADAGIRKVKIDLR